MTTTEIIREYVCKSTFCDATKLNDNTQLFDEGIFDSMGLLNLIAFLEDVYNVKVEDSELDTSNFGSINAIVSFLERKLESAELCAELQDL